MIHNSLQIERDLFEYIQKNVHADFSKVKPQTLLFKEGIFDSMGFVLLIDFLQEKFDIQTSDEDLIEENFESVNAITNFIIRKRTSAAAIV